MCALVSFLTRMCQYVALEVDNLFAGIVALSAFESEGFFFKEMLHVELHKCADLRDCHKNCKGAEEHVFFDGQSQPA